MAANACPSMWITLHVCKTSVHLNHMTLLEGNSTLVRNIAMTTFLVVESTVKHQVYIVALFLTVILDWEFKMEQVL